MQLSEHKSPHHRARPVESPEAAKRAGTEGQLEAAALLEGQWSGATAPLRAAAGGRPLSHSIRFTSPPSNTVVTLVPVETL